MGVEIVNLSSKYDEIEIHLTGFGPFGEININPTMKIVPLVSTNNPSIDIKSRQILRVSIGAVHDYISSIVTMKELQTTKPNTDVMLAIDEGLDPQTPNPPSKRVLTILVSLGVHSGSDQIRIEQCFYNRADFCIPDVDGNQPLNQPIDPNFPLDEQFFTKLDVYYITQVLNKAGYDVRLSFEPGRYVCNYLYCWGSLAIMDRQDFVTLFVHVTPLEVIGLMKQVKMIEEIIGAIGSLYLDNNNK